MTGLGFGNKSKFQAMKISIRDIFKIVFVAPLSKKCKRGFQSVRYDVFTITSEFEYESWKDLVRIPISYFKWLWACIVYFRMRFFDVAKAIKNDDKLALSLVGMKGRRDDPRPTVCPRCLWAGQYKHLWHTYGSDGYDSYPESQCPSCGQEL